MAGEYDHTDVFRDASFKEAGFTGARLSRGTARGR